MFTSLFSPEVQAVFDNAEKMAGKPAGPFPSPGDWRDNIIYFIIVDRFNNPMARPVNPVFDDPNFFSYQGGKFTGIEQQLGYIKNLGACAIWLSPVLKNLQWDAGSYHGYGIHDFIHAEPKFATDPQNADNELRQLVDAAHRVGLYVIFDIVLNHTGDVFAYTGNAGQDGVIPVQWRDENGHAVPAHTDIATIPHPSVNSIEWPAEFHKNEYFRRQGNPQPGKDDTVGDFESLKQLRTDNPGVQRFLIRAYQYVIARFDCDGFRIDTIRYLKGNLAQLFGNAVREYALAIGKKNFFTFGEVLTGDAESVIAEFIGRNTTLDSDPNNPVGVDAALDYPLYNALVGTLKAQMPPSSVVAVYKTRKDKEQFILSSHGDASRFFVSFLDNHDNKRRFRFAQPGNEHLFDDQVTMGLACLYCLPGIPCVYYGTEQGLHGSGTDAAVREALWGLFPGFPETGLFYTDMQKMTVVRNAQPALRYGRFYFRPVSGDSFHFGISNDAGGILAWSRILNDQEVIVVANCNTGLTIPVDVIVDRNLSSAGQNVEVLHSNKKIFTVPDAVKTHNNVSVAELNGSTGSGPVNATRVTLLPMEVQVLRGRG